MKKLTFLLPCLLNLGCSSMTKPITNLKDQPFAHLDYLENVEGSEALAFAKKNNGLSDARLKTDKRYQPTFEAILKIVSAKDKLPAFYIMNNEIYNFWQDNVHIKGILRKTSIPSFNTGKPEWKLVLDVDKLAEIEKENWVYKGIFCLDPDYTTCMVSLSRGGKDASTLREFNLKTGDFVTDGLAIPESKSAFAWLNKDTLLVGDATDPATLTSSGYPSQVKVLKRGQQLKNAEVIFKCDQKCLGVGMNSQFINDRRYVFVTNQISFFEAEEYLLNTQNMRMQPLAIPKTSNLVGHYKDHLLFTNRDPLNEYPAGSLLSISENEMLNSNPVIQPVFIPTVNSFYEYSMFSKDHLWVVTLNEVKKRVLKYRLESAKWTAQDFSFSSQDGNTGITATDVQSNHVYLSYSDFLTPTTIYHLDESASEKKPVSVLKAPVHFNSTGFNISQFKAKSKDGTQVPYFVVYSKSLKFDGSNPTLLYGYGGFEISMTSAYLGATGKVWLEKGGVYVLSNIRGGGEYGPAWHQAALRENRHKAYEDFYAIAEDLIKRKITSSKHLGIRGGSNGGLLTSVSFVQRPELFNAVISEVPLANMLEYHNWLAGASWVEEYGNPEDKNMREYLLSYSPLHNLVKDAKYPEVFYLTSTKDDRVHPGHARQMVARLQELGHPVLYNENTDGGHGRASNMKDLAEFLALEFTYLYQKLF